MDKVIINSVIEHMNVGELDRFASKQLKERIKNIFDLNEKQTEEVYRIWKCQYMKPKAD